jgi:putative peptidoglycan lipid II flippase
LVSLLPATGLILMCLALSSVLAGSLQAAAQYNLPTLSRGLLGIGVAAGLAAGGGRWGVAAGGAGLLAGAAAQLGLLAAAQWRLGWRPAWPQLRHTGLARAAAVGMPVVLTLALAQIVVGGVQRALASSLPEGSLAAVNYASRAMNLMAAVSVAFGTVSLTELAVQFRREGAGAETRRALENSAQGVFFVFVPISVLMFMLAEPVVAVLFQRGQYDEASLRLTAVCLRWYSLAGVSGALNALLVRAAYPAFGRLWRVVLNGILSALASVLVTAALLRAGAGVVALPIGFGVGMVLNSLLSIVGLWDIVGTPFVWALARYALRVALLAAAAAVALVVVDMLAARLAAGWSPWLLAMARCVGGGAAFSGVYGGLALATREPQAALLWRGAARRLGAWRGREVGQETSP